MAIEKLLVNGSLAEFQSFLIEIGFLRLGRRYEEFQLILYRLGMGLDEIVRFWEAIDLDSCGPNYGTADTRLSASCGVLLNSKKLPRNLFLYRLFQLKFPNVLTIVMNTVACKKDVFENRWEYAGPGRRSVMLLKAKVLMSEKKERPPRTRKRRRWPPSYDDRG